MSQPLQLLDPSDPRWTAFAAAQPDALVFHHPAWLEVLTRCYGYRAFVVALCDDAGHLRAGLPMMAVRSPLGKERWAALPFTDQCPPLAADEEARTAFAAGLVELNQNGTAADIEVRWDLPPAPSIHPTSGHVLTTLALDPDPDVVAGRIKRKYFRQIRVAEDRGVQVRRATDAPAMEQFYRLHVLSRRHFGLPVQPRKFFDLLRERLMETGRGFLVLAYHGEECLAAAVFLHWQRTLTYKYSACTEHGRQLLANEPLLWEAIRWGCENGFTRLDMGRSELEHEGLRAFKSHWGGVETPLVYSILAPHAPPAQPQESPLIKLAGPVIRHSPPWVCRVTGELLYRYFG